MMYNNNHSSLRRECKQFPLSIKISPQVNVTSHHFFHFFHYSDFFEYLHFFEYLNFYNKKEIWLYNKTWVWGGGGGFSPLSGNGIPFTLFQLVSPDCGNWLTRWWNFHCMGIFVYGVIYRLHFHWLVKIFNNYTSISKNEYGGVFSQYSTPWASACLQ